MKAWLQRVGIGSVVLVILFLLVMLANLMWAAKRVPERAQLAEPAVEIKRAPTKRVPVKTPVTVFTGDTKKKLQLPDEVQKNEAQQVVAATQVKRTERPQTVTTVLNTETGETQQFVRQDPFPWFAIDTRGEARLSVGYRVDARGQAQQILRLGVTYDAIRVKAVTAGVSGSLDSDGQSFLGVGIAYRW